ncbi:MAG: 50S ribosomal protein L10 [Christensenellales bacterium]
MSKFREQKEAKVADIKEKLSNAKSFLIIDYKGISVEQDTLMRKEYRENGCNYEVLKNSLVKIALNDLGYTQFDSALKGPTAIAMANTEDIAAPARIAFAKSKEYKKMSIKCGLADGAFLNQDQCRELASLPGKQTLIAQLLGMLQAPIASFARVIDAIANR